MHPLSFVPLAADKLCVKILPRAMRQEFPNVNRDEHVDPVHQWSVIGHGWAVHLLGRAVGLSSEETADSPRRPMAGPRHAYLLLGPPQVGKTTLARAFAQALLCTHPTTRPCGQCRSCRLMARGSHPDFRLVAPVDRAGDVDRANGILRVEQATEIIREAALSPMEGTYKFFLVQDMHRANDSFSNKLLKTLEEPAPQVVLCLTAHDRTALLSTIVSRCQILELRPLDSETIERGLIEKWQAEREQAVLLARLANGRLGWAVTQLQDSAGWQQRREQLQQLWQLSKAGRVERLAFASKLAANRNDQHLFSLLALWVNWWRDVMLAQAGSMTACSNVDFQTEIESQARAFSSLDVRQYLHTLARIESYLHHTVNTGLALDVLLLQLPRSQHSRT